MNHFLLLIILLTTSVQATLNYSGEINNYGVYLKSNMKQHKSLDESVYYGSLQTNINYTNNKWFFQTTPYIYGYQTASNNKLQTISGMKGDKFDIFFRSLYLKYRLSDTIQIGGGLLPFSNSAFRQYSNDYISDGEGLSTLNNNDLLSAFLTYSFNSNNFIIIGLGTHNSYIIPSGNYMSEKLEDTMTNFLIFKHKKNKYQVILEMMYSDEKYTNVDVGYSLIGGMGISWDDSMESGWTIYNINGLSYFNSKISRIADRLLSDNNINPQLVVDFPEQFALDDDEYYGASILLGFRKDLDIFPLETMINFEWFHTFGDWGSNNRGTPYTSNGNQSYDVKNDSFFLNFGITLSNNSILKFNYTFIEHLRVSKFGKKIESIASEDSIFTPDIQSQEIFKIEWKHKF